MASAAYVRVDFGSRSAQLPNLTQMTQIGHLVPPLYEKRLLEIVQDKFVNGYYQWNVGDDDFNLGLYRGLSGVGYTLLRRLDPFLPNLLLFE